MKKCLMILVSVMMVFSAACQAAPETQSVLPHRFADRAEGITFFQENTDYHNGFTQNDLDYRLQKKGGTAEEWVALACEQVLDFSDGEKAAIDNSMNRIRTVLAEKGYVLPALDEIVFVKTTMKEEGYVSAYTHKNQIYLGEYIISLATEEDEAMLRFFDTLMCHEIFHCLTRHDPQFRADIYDILGFTVVEEDFEMGPAVLERFISNPDVQRHNSYAEFTVNGEKMDCFTVLITTKPFEKEGEYFAQLAITGLVPIDDTNTIYTIADTSDFWEVFGRNTDYVIDPEECLADNFSYTVMFDDANDTLDSFESPHIIEAMDAYLKDGAQ